MGPADRAVAGAELANEGQRQPESVEIDIEEVRVAMALNGGVSLAVWMGGCAVELDCARRAHWGEEKNASSADAGPLANERRIYWALADAFKRRMTIDIMTGASAGGINGALLAAAMVRKRRLHPDFVRERWLKLGDLSDLLHKSTDAAPRSLMQGERFDDEVHEVFEMIEGLEAAPLLDLPSPQS